MLTFQETLAPLHCTEKNTDAAALQTAVQLVSVSPLPMSRANAIALVQKYIKKKNHSYIGRLVCSSCNRHRCVFRNTGCLSEV